MKVVVSRSDLAKGINTVQSAVAAKNTMPILANILLEAKESRLEFVATDLDMGIRLSVPAEVVNKGSLTINARKISDICRELPDASVDLETDEGQKLTLVCQKSQFKINGMSKDDFPILPEVKKDKSYKLKGSLLQEMIRKTLFAVSNDETRYVLNGVFFQIESGKCRLVSTDGHRLAYIQKKLEGKSDDKVSMIIPTKALIEVSKIISESGKGKEKENKDTEDVTVEITASENQVKFSVTGVEIISRLIEGQFPNYEQVIPKEAGKKIDVPTSLLAAATRRVSILASEKSNSIKFKFAAGKTTVSAITPDVGEAKEELDIPFDGDEISIAFNAKYVLDVLKNVGTETTVVELTQSLNPGLFRPKADADYLCVIMPMRI